LADQLTRCIHKAEGQPSDHRPSAAAQANAASSTA